MYITKEVYSFTLHPLAGVEGGGAVRRLLVAQVPHCWLYYLDGQLLLYRSCLRIVLLTCCDAFCTLLSALSLELGL